MENKITLHDVVDSLIYIRDHVLTDENIESVSSIIDKMSIFVGGIYQWISKEDVPDELYIEAKSRNIELETHTLMSGDRSLWDNMMNSFAERDLPDISIEGLLDAISFIRDHLTQGDDILQDLSALFQSLLTVKDYSEQEEESSSRTLEMSKHGVDTLYQELTQ